MTGTEALLAIGTGLSVANTIQQGQAEASRGGLQSALLKQDAERTRAIGVRDAGEFNRSISRMLGTRMAEGGGSGAEMTGTFKDVDKDIVTEAAFQRLKILSGSEDAAQKKEMEAKFAEMAGLNKRRTSRLKAGSQIFTGSAKLGFGTG